MEIIRFAHACVSSAHPAPSTRPQFYTKGTVSSMPTALFAPSPVPSAGGGTEKITMPPRATSDNESDHAIPDPKPVAPSVIAGLCTPSTTASRQKP
eukprot:COSAG02_NODE_2778_length_8051_cov_829.131162_8_plen_96_part_00